VATYDYKAVDQKGLQAKGQMDALNEVDLEIRLERMGLDLITFNETSKAKHGLGKSRVGSRDLIMFCFQLEQLTTAGVPILDGLNDLQESTENPYFKKVLNGIFSDVEGGKMLSDALAAHEDVFDDVFVSLIAAGEKTGQLSTVFDNLSETLKWQDELFAQTKRLLAYPLFVFVVVMAAVTFLMIYLVPEMVKFIGSLGQELPLNTRILIFLSDAFVNYWWLFLGLPVLAVLAVTAWVKSSADARYKFDYLKLKVPVTGEILNKIIMARFARYFALMYEAGIPVLDAIKTCENIVGNKVIADSLNRAHSQINGGDSMSESFQSAGLFPALVVRMVRVGESSGALDKALMNISYFYDRDVNEQLQKMLKMLEPALTVVLGVILMFIMISVLGPVYDSFSYMKL